MAEDLVVSVGIAAEVKDDAPGRGQLLYPGAYVLPGSPGQVHIEDAVLERVDGLERRRDGHGRLRQPVEGDFEDLAAALQLGRRFRPGWPESELGGGLKTLPLGRSGKELLVLPDDVRGLRAVDREDDVAALERLVPGGGDDGSILNPFDQEGRCREFLLQGVVDAAVAVVEPGDEPAERPQEFLLGPVGEGPFEGLRQDRVPIDLDRVEIRIEVLEDVPGDDDIAQADAFVRGGLEGAEEAGAGGAQPLRVLGVGVGDCPLFVAIEVSR
jgi:hypothetical protein